MEVGAAEDRVAGIIDDREWQARLENCDAGNLPVVQERAGRARIRLGFRQVVSAADYQPVLAIKVRPAIIPFPVILVARETGQLINRSPVVIIIGTTERVRSG